jgi:hypothetical protein
MKNNSLNNKLRIISIILLFITSLNALAAGYSFIVEPSGVDLGMNVGYLKYSPFDTFLMPGLILFIIIGLGCVYVAVVAILKKAYYPLLVLSQGSIITGWIMVQVLMLRMFHTLHLIIFVIGVVLIITGFILPRNQQTNT